MQDKQDIIHPGSMRDVALEASKSFKSSWVELGRVLYSIWKDKLYKEWNYQQFDIYVSKELGIRKQTSLKLLRSYYFLEKEEPMYLQKEYADDAEAKEIPSYEAIDVLRLAKSKNIDGEDYAKLKEDLFVKGKDSKEIKRDLTTMMRQREEIDPQEAWQKKKETNIRRFIGTLKSLKREMDETKILPAAMAQEVNALIKKLESQL
ncbi:MAG: hypothetical protein WCX16_00560 [Candidatus Omnitrophota bacterium]